jgi:hypothetical protein
MTDEERTHWDLQLNAVPRGCNSQADEEVSILIGQAEGQCDFFVCKALLGTFSDDREEDGTQESVLRVLSSADPDERACALLVEAPRLAVQAPNWLEMLIEQGARFHPASQAGHFKSGVSAPLIVRCLGPTGSRGAVVGSWICFPIALKSRTRLNAVSNRQRWPASFFMGGQTLLEF